MVGRSSYWQGDCGKGRLMAGKLWEGESGGGKGRHLIVEPMFSSLTIHSSDLSFFGGKCPCISASLSFFFTVVSGNPAACPPRHLHPVCGQLPEGYVHRFARRRHCGVLSGEALARTEGPVRAAEQG